MVNAHALTNLTLLQAAVPKGAVCLDGSPPSYAYLQGTGNGSRNWIVFMEGGGWCVSTENCVERSHQYLGSSYHTSNEGSSSNDIFSGILNSDAKFNPDFYDWHRVYIHYCDGSVFLSDVEEVDPATNLTFRGARIYNAMMEKMLSKGMGNAKNAVLTGSSAGGMSTILHCDKFRALFPKSSRVKCISDSGFIIHGKGEFALKTQRHFAQVIETHKLTEKLPTSCTSKWDPNLCLFPEYLIDDVDTPLFLVESTFDTFQIGYSYIFGVGGGQRPSEWQNCLKDLALCNDTQKGIIKGFGPIMIDALLKLDYSSSRGIFADSCYLHTHIQQTYGWMCSSIVANKTIRQAVGDWYFDRSLFQEIDSSPWPRSCSSSGNSKTCVATLSQSGSEQLLAMYRIS